MSGYLAPEAIAPPPAITAQWEISLPQGAKVIVQRTANAITIHSGSNTIEVRGHNVAEFAAVLAAAAAYGMGDRQ